MKIEFESDDSDMLALMTTCWEIIHHWLKLSEEDYSITAAKNYSWLVECVTEEHEALASDENGLRGRHSCAICVKDTTDESE